MTIALRRGLQRRVASILTDGAQALGTLAVASTLAVTGQALVSDGVVGAPGLAFSGAPSTGIYRDGSGQVGHVRLGTSMASITASGLYCATELNIAAGSILLYERTAPGVPAANTMRVFGQDNGAGKTQLAVRFATGAVQTPATEP